MSGYLEVKYPFKSSLGLNPFKTWKRQWCILRPSWTSAGGGCLAVYCSEAGAAAGTLEIPPGSVVRRAKSRSRAHAFAVFAPDEPRKPRVLLAAASSHETQLWMDKIKNLLTNNKFVRTGSTLRDTYSVSVGVTELSQRCDLEEGDGILQLEPAGVALTSRVLIPWTSVQDVERVNNTCLLHVDSSFGLGPGTLALQTPLAAALARALARGCRAGRARRLSRSDGDLRARRPADHRPDRSGCYSGPSEVSLDDTDLLMSKESRVIPGGQLARCAAAGDLAPCAAAASLSSFDDSMSDRRSLVSVASGVYEEIADAPLITHRAAVPEVEPTYESVAECVYATMRRGKRCPPPPLPPPRKPFNTTKLGESWSSRLNKAAGDGVTRHSSLGSLPRCCSLSSANSGHSEGYKVKTLPKPDRKTFNVFRKRLKSDSRPSEPKSPETKENRDETKKKKFDFTPTKELFKNFRKIKSLKIKSGSNLAKIGETKSCEFLDGTEHVSTNTCTSRCSKSVECLEGSPSEDYLDDSDTADFSLELDDDAVASLSLPQDIVALILRGRERIDSIGIKQQLAEDDYMPMSPIVAPTPIEQHYIVMSPRTNIA